MINDEGLTISTNLFGTTYYSLVGLHAFHVTMGLLALTIVAALYFSARLRREHAERIEMLSMYWHFVDAVWVVVFTVVYVIGVSAMKIPETIEVPAPTAWPVVLAFGMTLVFAGLVTAMPVTILGAILAGAGAVGWFRDVLPVEKHESLPVVQEDIAIETSRESVERIAVLQEVSRASLPVEIYPISAGVKGGLAGGAAMALLAGAYGLVSGNGIWYPMNLLVAGFFPEMATQTASQIGAFSAPALLFAVPIHLMISLLVGLLYGAMLPIASKRPILLGGFAAPLLWSFLIHGSLAVINPVMNQRIHWVWFALSQIGFGIVAGLIVARQERISTPQPWRVRMGIEAPGLMGDIGNRPESRP